MWHQGGQIYLINRGSMFSPCAVQAGEDKARLSHSLHCYCPHKEAHPKKHIILPRRPREGCIGSLIQRLGYVNKQFALQRDDMTKELWRQN